MLPCLTHINLSLGSVLAFRTLDLQDNVPDFFYLKYFWSVQTRFIFFRSTDPLPNLACWENLDPTWLSNLTELLETCEAKKSLREWMQSSADRYILLIMMKLRTTMKVWKLQFFIFFSSKIDMSGDLNPESNIATFCFGWIVSNNLPLFNQMIAH